MCVWTIHGHAASCCHMCKFHLQRFRELPLNSNFNKCWISYLDFVCYTKWEASGCPSKKSASAANFLLWKKKKWCLSSDVDPLRTPFGDVTNKCKCISFTRLHWFHTAVFILSILVYRHKGLQNEELKHIRWETHPPTPHNVDRLVLVLLVSLVNPLAATPYNPWVVLLLSTCHVLRIHDQGWDLPLLTSPGWHGDGRRWERTPSRIHHRIDKGEFPMVRCLTAPLRRIWGWCDVFDPTAYKPWDRTVRARAKELTRGETKGGSQRVN